jgi:GMP synthase-like glutamine amidotransferase/DNA-binding CsgD family transcriptional regulator/tetratricopeptide (TPR) repeat protein
MRALALEHLRSDPIGIFGDVLAERGIAVDRILLHEGEPLPEWSRYDLLVAMGAGASVWEEDEFPWIVAEKRAVREAVLGGVPYFGVCFGAQLLADVFGARSFRGPEPELGVDQVFLTAAARRDPVFRGFPADLEVCEWHSNHFSLPEGAVRLARSPRYENQAIRYGRVAYGLQCHLEPGLDDIRAWLAEFPETAVTFEARHGRGSLERLLEDYADFVPFLQTTARQVFGRWLEHALAFGGLGGAAHAARAGNGRAGSQPSGGLVGRRRELARIDAALASARRGESAVLVLRGEGGAGKTALLDAADGRARGLLVLRARGEDADPEQPFAGLAEICRPLTERLDLLSPPRAEAVVAILDPKSGARFADRFALYAGALDLLSATAADEPLVVLIDDAHLLDDASREAVAFIARRLGADGIALLLATEADDDLPESEDLRLGGLAAPDARALLGGRWRDLDPSVADRVVAAAAGNPLALLEIPVDLTPEQRAGTAAIDETLPASAEWAFLRRLSRLPAPTRQAVLVVALAGRHERQAIARACQTLEVDVSMLEAAEAAGLLRREGDLVAFRHPLARTTVAYSALRADRRATHAALAGALDGASRAWHLARAATHPDESIAAELERIAASAHDHGAFSAAASGLELAARLTPSEDTRSERLLAAARAAHLAGHVNAALNHLDAALAGAPADRVRRDAEHLHGRVVARSGSAEAARDRLVAVAAQWEGVEPARAGEMLADAVLPSLRAGEPAEAVRIARRATRLARDGNTRAALASKVALGTALVFAGQYAEGAALIDDVVENVERAGDRQLRAYLGAGLVLIGRHPTARRVLRQLIDEARGEGAVSVLPYALIRLADVEVETGGWAAGAAALHEARQLAHECGQPADYGLALGGLAWLDAAQGRDDSCRARVDEALELAQRLGSGSRLDRAAMALGLLELGRGDPESAIPHLEAACRLQDEQGWSDAARTPHRRPDLVEAYVLAARDDDARRALDRFEREAERTRRPSALAAAARCRGLLAYPNELDAAFGPALAAGDEATGPFERARTELLYGDRLAGAGRAQDARRILTGALTTFERLAAEAWAERARHGILRTGGTPPAPRASLIERLSSRELEVALAAIEGGSPQEIAEQLFLGPRTVELDLASAAIKLGVGSSAELASILQAPKGPVTGSVLREAGITRP